MNTHLYPRIDLHKKKMKSSFLSLLILSCMCHFVLAQKKLLLLYFCHIGSQEHLEALFLHVYSNSHKKYLKLLFMSFEKLAEITAGFAEIINIQLIEELHGYPSRLNWQFKLPETFRPTGDSRTEWKFGTGQHSSPEGSLKRVNLLCAEYYSTECSVMVFVIWSFDF